MAEKIAPAEQKRLRCAEIGEALYEMHLDGGDGEKYLATYIDGGAFPDQTNECLFNVEEKKRARRPDFDVTTLPPKALARLLDQGVQIEAETTTEEESAETAMTAEAAAVGEESEEEAGTQAAEDKEATLSAFQTWYAEQSGPLDAIQNAHTMPEGLEAQKARLMKFQSMLTIARQVSPQDYTVISRQMAKLDMSQGVQDPVAFARAFVFDSPNSEVSTGVSDAAQNAIAAKLGIVRNQFDVKTGGDVNDIYKKGVGTEKYLDENGEVQERPVYLQPGEDVEIRKGQYIGLSDTNEPVMKIVGEHTYTSDLPDNPTDEDMTMYGMTTQWIAKLNDVNMAEIFFPHSVMERGGGHIELNMPDDFNRAQRLSQAFFGAMAGYNGELLDQSDLARIPYLMQFQNEKGDAVIGDVNPDQMKADYRRQGLLDKDGALNWTRFAAMIEANRNGLYVSERNYGQAAQAVWERHNS